MTRALVTGGAGFIGSHLVDVLLARGDQVTVVDHLSRGHTDNLTEALAAGVELHRVEVTDVQQMLAVFNAVRPEVVYHLAAQVDVRRSVADPSTDAHVNVGGTAAVLEAARDTGTRRVILASTAAVYGDPPELPITEETPIAPLSPYGASKAAAETYMQLFQRLHGVSTLALRMANVYGPRQDPHGEAGVVAIFTGAARERRRPTIFGDGRQTRDYVYVSDVVAAFAAAGAADVTGVLERLDGAGDERGRAGARARARARPSAREGGRDPALVPGSVGGGAGSGLARGGVAGRGVGAVLIPLFDLRLAEEDVQAVLDVLRSGWLTMGPKTAEFEAAFAAHLGVRHAVAVSSCTAALHLAYLAAGIGPGDEVIVPAMTFAATAAAVVYCGGTPVFAEIAGPHDLALDPVDVAAKITPRTKAVCVVHFAGYPAAVRELRALCDAHGLALIEDVAHAPYAHVDGQSLGTFGLAGAFSFFSNKVLACGEGGLVATDDDDVAALARSRRSQAMTSGTWSRHTGETETYDAVGLGYNYRLDEPRSALLLSRLARLRDGVERRRELTRRYRSKLAGIDGVIVPYSDESVEHSTCYVMPILVERDRDGMRARLKERGIQTSIFYPAVHEFVAYRERFGTPSLPRTEFVARSEITLPLFAEMTEDQQDQVVEALR